MTESRNVRLIKHEVVPKCGSFEVRFADGRPSRFFYWEDVPGTPPERAARQRGSLRGSQGVRKEGPR
jgi:hypothetical protein